MELIKDNKNQLEAELLVENRLFERELLVTTRKEQHGTQSLLKAL